MMKIFGKISVVIAVSLFLVAPVQAQLFKKGLKIGYVDIAKVFDQYKRTDIATEELKKDIEDKRKEIEKKRESINIIKQKVEAQGVVINEEEKVKMEGDVEAQITELKEMTEKSNRDLRQQEQKFIKDILDDIKETVNIYGKDNDYDLILDSREVLYGPEGMDITDEIAKIININLKNK